MLIMGSMKQQDSPSNSDQVPQQRFFWTAGGGGGGGVLFLADAPVSIDALPDDSTRKSEIEEETNGETGPIISSNDTLIIPEGDTELSTWMELERVCLLCSREVFFMYHWTVGSCL